VITAEKQSIAKLIKRINQVIVSSDIKESFNFEKIKTLYIIKDSSLRMDGSIYRFLLPPTAIMN